MEPVPWSACEERDLRVPSPPRDAISPADDKTRHTFLLFIPLDFSSIRSGGPHLGFERYGLDSSAFVVLIHQRNRRCRAIYHPPSVQDFLELVRSLQLKTKSPVTHMARPNS